MQCAIETTNIRFLLNNIGKIKFHFHRYYVAHIITTAHRYKIEIFQKKSKVAFVFGSFLMEKIVF